MDLKLSRHLTVSEGKDVFLKESPEVALIDVHMPKIDGFDALRFAKEKLPRTIVVVMSSAANPQIGVKAMKMGADDFLTKPFVPEAAVELVESLLENRRFVEENTRLKNQIHRGEKVSGPPYHDYQRSPYNY